jgi:hypothetical protein
MTVFNAHGQSVICDTLDLKSVDEINFSKIDFVSHDTIIDKIKYNCRSICPTSKARIYGNLDKKNRKYDHWIIFDHQGELFVQGNFIRDKKDGWWFYNGCCKSFYKNDKKEKTICITF